MIPPSRLPFFRPGRSRRDIWLGRISLLVGAVIGVAIVGLVFSGWGPFVALGGWSSAERQSKRLLASSANSRLRTESPAQDSTYEALEVFDSALVLIREQHLEPVEAESLMDGAVRGLFDALDPDSAFLSPTEADLYREGPSGRVGIGLQKRYYLHVDDVLPGSPAAEAGIERGAAITAIDGMSTRDLRVPAGLVLLSGRPGSRVELSLRNAGESGSETVVLQRVAAGPTPVEHELLADQVGLIRIRRFHDTTPVQLAAAVRALAARGADALALDLRGSRGVQRDCEAGVESAGVFMEGVVAERVRRNDDGAEVSEPLETPPGDPVWDGPLAVMIDGSTVCPGEVLAAALSTRQQADVVGGRSAGRSGQPEMIELAGGSAILLSTTHVRGFEGEDILGLGVSPTASLQDLDLTVENLDEENPELDLALRALEKRRDTAPAPVPPVP